MLQENEALLIHFYLYELSYFSQYRKTVISEKFLGILERPTSWQLICLLVQSWQTDTQASISLWINNARLQVTRRKGHRQGREKCNLHIALFLIFLFLSEWAMRR